MIRVRPVLTILLIATLASAGCAVPAVRTAEATERSLRVALRTVHVVAGSGVLRDRPRLARSLDLAQLEANAAVRDLTTRTLADEPLDVAFHLGRAAAAVGRLRELLDAILEGR